MNTFMIIDDDISTVKMLSNFIKANNLGKVVGELYSGEYAIEEILFYDPDIVLIDYLLPHIDGAEIITAIRTAGYKGKFIMISQIEDEAMISKAYNMGVLFFISKPINSIELINVIKNVSHSIELERSLDMIKSALFNVPTPSTNLVQENNKIESILTDLGIITDSGAHDLINLIYKIQKYKVVNPNIPYRLSEFYEEIIGENTENDYESLDKNIRTLEQRIRRTIQKSLNNIAEIGINDFYNPIFVEYSTLLYDLKQVKQQMRYIENPSLEKGKINIKKFIEGCIVKL